MRKGLSLLKFTGMTSCTESDEVTSCSPCRPMILMASVVMKAILGDGLLTLAIASKRSNILLLNGWLQIDSRQCCHLQYATHPTLNAFDMNIVQAN